VGSILHLLRSLFAIFMYSINPVVLHPSRGRYGQREVFPEQTACEHRDCGTY
jgi:hypothetical protein